MGFRNGKKSYFIDVGQGAKTVLIHEADTYIFKVNNKNTGTRCEICSKLTTKKPGQRQ